MTLLNICTKKEFDINGNIVTKWYKVGTLKIAESGKQYIKLFQQPDTEFFVFEKEPLVPEDRHPVTR
jgi:hypothetical protein